VTAGKSRDRWVLDVISALRFDAPDETGLSLIAESDWAWLLNEADRCHITLPLAIRCLHLFPADARRRLDDTRARNVRCHQTILSAYLDIANAFERANIPFLVLKGLAQWPWFVDDPAHRVQSDIDFYCPPAFLEAARAVLAELGYEAVHGNRSQPVDHLPVMIRKTGWQWQGDYYDPERPPSIELHFRFWDDATEGFRAGGLASFWDRRTTRDISGIQVPTLSAADNLKYSSMHLIRHLLRGDLQVRHVYELAHFMERTATLDSFWSTWAKSAAPRESLIELMAIRLASEWFGCRLHSAPRRLIERTPAPVDRWFRLFALSPAIGAMKPNKDELWLHFCLVTDKPLRRQIAIRRLIPVHRQRVVLDPHVQSDGGLVVSLRRILYEVCFLAVRAVHHVRSLVPVLRSGFRWWKAGAALL
jgi:Uncharacterised nucleotidyltransferase